MMPTTLPFIPISTPSRTAQMSPTPALLDQRMPTIRMAQPPAIPATMAPTLTYGLYLWTRLSLFRRKTMSPIPPQPILSPIRRSLPPPSSSKTVMKSS